MLQKLIFSTLAAICITGIIGIPMGDPQFIANAILLESVFVTLAVISLWRIKIVAIPGIIISMIVIIGNTASPKHMTIMTSLVPIENAIVLIVGGYALQGLLLMSSSILLIKRKQLNLNMRN